MSSAYEDRLTYETPRAHITVKRIVFTSPRPKFPDGLTQMMKQVLQFVIWCKQQKVVKFDGVTWFNVSDKWSALIRDSQTKMHLPDIMVDEDTNKTEEMPPWCRDETFSDFVKRAYQITDRLNELMQGYNQTSPTFIRSFVSNDRDHGFRTFMVYARVPGVPTLPNLLTHLYYDDPEDMPDKGAMSKIALMNLLCASHPEISATFSVQSPRVPIDIKDRIQSNANRMIMISLAHACYYFLMADRQVVLLLFRIWVRMSSQERLNMYNYFGWLTAHDNLLEYLQIACIIEDDRQCLLLVHKLMIDSQTPRAFKVNDVVNRWVATPRVRQRSASITIMEHQDITQLPPPDSPKGSGVSQSSPCSAPSSSRGGDKPSPWRGVGPYARSLYTAIVQQSNSCLALLYEDYEMLYEICRMSDLTLDRFDPELPAMTLKELFTQKGYKELSDNDSDGPSVSLGTEESVQ